MNGVLGNFARLSHFNYDQNGKDWNVNTGRQQSPVALTTAKAVKSTASELIFINYNKALSRPLKLTNNGHTLKMSIPCAEDCSQPAVCGCKLKSIYKAVQLHFHWGSPEKKGSEHSINCTRYDAELHIIHQNIAYALKENALCSWDGFVVLAIMVNIVECPTLKPRVLNEVFNKSRFVRNFNKTSTIEGTFSLSDILAGVKCTEFFTYKGSLTAPPCAEVVNWYVFPKPVEVLKTNLQNLWLLADDRGKPLRNNYRLLQSLNNRTVYYRTENAT
ncbi:putative carbonic anhydrase 3 isoform X3 [Drosophila grimshawi]|uniref:putative carbonic anhydrase 3 isoform X3 n=2 Tax=Drosophila grimshawi TaxID=7222 RepID=UPI000C870F14|nr:putative carbonic anhydrase 3 isoform X3 [Drosophila grimshawi]